MISESLSESLKTAAGAATAKNEIGKKWEQDLGLRNQNRKNKN